MPDEQPQVFRVNGKEHAVPTEFTLGEMCDMERYFGVQWGADMNTASVSTATAMLYIAIRRDDPTITVDDVRALPPDVFASLAEDDARPPEPSATESETDPSGSDSPHRFGRPSQRPESYWYPSLAHWFHLRPCDVGDLTAAQLMACADFIEEATKD